MQCDAIVDRLAGALDDPTALDAAQTRHLARCLRCQAELARYHRIGQEMGALRSDRVPLLADAAAEALGRLDTAIDRRSRQRRATWLGGLAAVTAAGVGSVVLLAGRRRTG